MNSSNLLLKMLGKVFVGSDAIRTSSFKKTGHTIDQESGDELITIVYRVRRATASPISSSKRPKDSRRGRLFDDIVSAVKVRKTN